MGLITEKSTRKGRMLKDLTTERLICSKEIQLLQGNYPACSRWKSVAELEWMRLTTESARKGRMLKN